MKELFDLIDEMKNFGPITSDQVSDVLGEGALHLLMIREALKLISKGDEWAAEAFCNHVLAKAGWHPEVPATAEDFMLIAQAYESVRKRFVNLRTQVRSFSEVRAMIDK